MYMKRSRLIDAMYFRNVILTIKEDYQVSLLKQRRVKILQYRSILLSKQNVYYISKNLLNGVERAATYLYRYRATVQIQKSIF
jgi:hypothetical protein